MIIRPELFAEIFISHLQFRRYLLRRGKCRRRAEQFAGTLHCALKSEIHLTMLGLLMQFNGKLLQLQINRGKSVVRTVLHGLQKYCAFAEQDGRDAGTDYGTAGEKLQISEMLIRLFSKTDKKFKPVSCRTISVEWERCGSRCT